MSRKTSTGASYRADDVEYIATVERMIRAAGDRGAMADPFALKLIRDMASAVELAELIAVDGLRAAGYSWDYIAEEQGITRQSALRRYNRPEYRAAERQAARDRVAAKAAKVNGQAK